MHGLYVRTQVRTIIEQSEMKLVRSEKLNEAKINKKLKQITTEAAVQNNVHYLVYS